MVQHTEEYRRLDYVIPIFQIGAWSGFTNQPDGDDVEILSDSASDVGLCTVFYTQKSDGAFTHKTVRLAGTTAVSLTSGTDVDDVLGVYLGDVYGKNPVLAVGTITFREATGNAAITTITAGNLSKGMVAFKLDGKNVDVENITGTTWWNTVQVPDATVGGAQMSGRMSVQAKPGSGEYLGLISDTTGSTAQIYVFKND